MKTLLLFSLALLLELLAAATLLPSWDYPQQPLVLVSAHALASLAAALGVRAYMAARYGKHPVYIALLCFGWSLFVPLLGALSLAFATLLRPPPKRDDRSWLRTESLEAPHTTASVSDERPYSEGALADLLRHSPLAGARLNAVLAARQLPAQEKVPILRLALKDPVDDVRLLAYSMLDKLESATNARIAELESELAHRPDDVALHRQIAEHYWELTYVDLAQGEVYEEVLAQAQRYAERALTLSPSADLHALLGRIAMRRGDLTRAKECFTAAGRSGISAAAVAPYLAEVAFLERRFKDVARHLAELPGRARERPALAEVVDYWQTAQ